MRMTETDWSAVATRVEQARTVAADFAEALRARFGSRLHDVRLFGSAARGDWQEGSDVDVLILLDAVRGPDRDWIAEASTRIGILGSGMLLSTVTLPAERFEQLRRRERLFARDVDAQGLPL
jgi:hypothetical protein